MPPFTSAQDTENKSPYQIDSRREIIALLRSLKQSKQLINMLIKDSSEMFITTILAVDDSNNLLILDSPPGHLKNQRICQASKINFEGFLDKISIQFASTSLQPCQFEGLNALQSAIPESLIRLQRREYYHISTPFSQPIRCMIPLPVEETIENLYLPLVDISCGGIALLDEKRVLDTTPSRIYEHCIIELPVSGKIQVTLKICNSQDLILLNGKTNRRVGCQFKNLSSGNLASIQRYIMKLERERNAKITGLR